MVDMNGEARSLRAMVAGTRADAEALRPLRMEMRWLLMAFAVLTVLGFGALFVLAGQSARFFAWTIDPPITAAFMGAGYGAGFVLVLLALRIRIWAHARVSVITVLVFTLLTLVATLLHLDRFHFADPIPTARFAAWFWAFVYVAIPLAMLVVIPGQERLRGLDPAKRLPLPGWLAAVLAVQGTILLVTGVGLFLFPATREALWPWPLTPLTARAVASWLIAFGLAAWLAIRERDLERLQVAAVAYVVFGVLEVAVLVRYADVVQWAEPSAAVYLLVLLSVIPTGAFGWWAVRRDALRLGAARAGTG